MDDGPVADRHVVLNRVGLARIAVDDGAVLDIHPCADGDGRYVATHDRGEPDTGLWTKLDIARDLLDPDSFVATGVYEDGAALERQESRPEVHKVMAMLPESLAAPLERTIFDASVDPTLV